MNATELGTSSSAPPPRPTPPSYMPYLIAVQASVALICGLATIVLNTRLIYHGLIRNHGPNHNRMRVKQLSKTMWLYLVAHATGCALNFPNNVYILMKWNASGAPSVYDPYALYWVGQANSIYYTASPVPVVLLTIERCLALKIQWRNSDQLKNGMFYFSCSLLLFVSVGGFVYNLAELPLDMVKVASCQSYSCTLTKYHSAPQLWFKNGMEVVNLVVGVYFLLLLTGLEESHLLMNGGAGVKREVLLHNKVVKAVLILELLFNVIPTLFSYALNLFTGITTTTYVGYLSVVFLCMSAALSAWFYNWTLLQQPVGEMTSVDGNAPKLPTSGPSTATRAPQQGRQN